METRPKGFVVTAAIIATAVGTIISFSSCAPGQEEAESVQVGGNPNISGIWQSNNGANWDIEAHAARAGAIMQSGVYPGIDYAQVPAAPVLALGAAGGVPGSIGIVQGDGSIPYTPEALEIKQENAKNWVDRDPELKCYLPGIPRAMYMSFPFEITQSTNKIHLAYEFANAARTIHLDEVETPPTDLWMGHSVGHWEDDTLVVNVTQFNGKTWLDRAGNFHSEALELVERFTPITPNIIQYDVTLTDPNVFTEPWQISMPLYRRMEPNIQLMDYRCTEFVEEFLYGHVRREPLVQRWESETMIIDITRRVPLDDNFYDWYGK